MEIINAQEFQDVASETWVRTLAQWNIRHVEQLGGLLASPTGRLAIELNKLPVDLLEKRTESYLSNQLNMSLATPFKVENNLSLRSVQRFSLGLDTEETTRLEFNTQLPDKYRQVSQLQPKPSTPKRCMVIDEPWPQARFQGFRGTCVAFTVAAMMEGFVLAGHADNRWVRPPARFSEQYIYLFTKRLDPNRNTEGTHFTYATEAIRKEGACPEDSLPYEIYNDWGQENLFRKARHQLGPLTQMGRKFRVLRAPRLTNSRNVFEIKEILERKRMVGLGLLVFEDAWYNGYAASFGEIALPLTQLDEGEEILHMESDDEFDKVEIQFFGGEPMLAFNRMREIVEWFNSKKWRKEHLFNICTNGTILTEEMKTWLERNRKNVQVGFSIDGNRVSHNLTRSNSYDRLKRNIPFFRKNWPNQYAKMTISAENIPHVAASIIDLEELEIPFTANVVFEDIWGTPQEKKRLLAVYESQLNQLVDYYLENADLHPASIVDRKIEFISDPDTRINNNNKNSNELDKSVRFCGAGHEMIEIDIDGSISPCHRFASWVTRRPAPVAFVNRQKQWLPEFCAKCKILPICPTCAGFNWEINGDSGIRTTFHCEAFKLEVLASANLQAQRLIKKEKSTLANESPETKYRLTNVIDSILDLFEDIN